MRYWLAMLAAAAAPGAAMQLKNPLAATVDPADRAVMAEAASAIATRQPDLARLDAVLAKLPRPTPLRGMVQTMRAGALATGDRTGEAVAAIEEAMRLLPDDPRPKMVATATLTFAGSPQRAADLWLQASVESPDIARMSDRYVMMALAGRLADLGDRARADRVNARLGEIGFSAGLAPERSGAALARTRAQLDRNETDLAVQGVTAIGDPDDLLGLYVDRRYEALWPRIAEWASPTLEDQSRRYLEELRADWTAASDFETATPYARRLANLDAYAAVVSLFLPMFDRVGPDAFPKDAEFLAPVVARSLVRVGRAAEASALLARVGAAMPKNESGSDLNILAARMLAEANDLDWAATLAQADAFIARAKQLGPAINASATLQVQAARACALWKLDRVAAAQEETAAVMLGEVLMPGPALQIQLCRGDIAGARALMVRRLADEQTRGWALRFVQPARPDLFSPLDRLTQPVAEAVRAAPDVRAAATRIGRLLPQPVLTGLPAGFDPFRARPVTQPVAGNAT